MRRTSLLSVQARNLTQTHQIGEEVEKGELVEITNIHGVFMRVTEKMVEYEQRLGAYPAFSARKPPLHGLMILRTVEQVRRVFLIIAGFTLLLAGAIMLVTPGPGMLVIFLGLGLLAAEFVWARRLMDRLKHEGVRLADRFTPSKK